MMKKLLLILIPSVLLLSSCESDEPSRIEVNQEDLNLTLNDEGEKVFTFKTTDSWAVSVTDTSSVEWLSLSHLRGGKGENSIEIKAAPNNTFADRRALLTVKSGNSQFTVGVLQAFGNGVTDIDIPDKFFKEYCISYFDVDKDQLLSYKEVKDVRSVNIFYNSILGVKSLKGIEYFTNLENLVCDRQYLIEIDLSKNTKLKSLNCSDNMLKSIDLSRNTELTLLKISNNNLKELDLSKNTKLTELYCFRNSLELLNLENLTELQKLECEDNSLSALDLSGTKKLTKLECENNNIVSLDVSDNTNLVTIYCHSNKLTSLDVSGCTSLRTLRCENNLLTTVNTSGCVALYYLNCNNNKITSLDLSTNTKLDDLECQNNLLSTLDMRNNNKIWYVSCYGNPNLREIWFNKSYSTPYIYKDSHTTIVKK